MSKKLKMRDVLTREAYETLTATERRRLLKVAQAKEYSGWSNYPDTCAAIMQHLPSDIWERYTAEQIGEIMRIVHDAYQAGRHEKTASDHGRYRLA